MASYENSNIHEEYAELLQRVRNGDESAFTEIYQKSERLVYNTCYRILNNKENAEDAMQETYLALYNNIDTINDGKALVAWLSRTAYFRACDLGDKNKDNLAYEDAIANEVITEEADDNLDALPESYITVKTNRDIISKILKDELNESQYITTLLYYYNELPVSEIASMMNCPEGTIKTRLSESRRKIKKGIESYEHTFGDKLAGAAGVPFLTKFFIECSKELTLPVINPLPVNIPATPSAAGELTETGAKTGELAKTASSGGELSETGEPLGELAKTTSSGGELSETGDPVGELAQDAAKGGDLAKDASKAGQLAKNAGTAGSGAKAGVLASPLAKIGIAVAALAVVAVPTVIIVNAIKDKDDDKADKTYKIKTDGLYCNIDEDEETTDCFRFYSDGVVIYTSYEYDSDDYFPYGDWFNVESGDDRVEIGSYEVDDNDIKITLYDGSKFSGEIKKEVIILDKEEYKYYEFDDIDGYISDFVPVAPSTETTETTEPSDPTATPTPTPDPSLIDVNAVYSEYLEILEQNEEEIHNFENSHYKFDRIYEDDPRYDEAVKSVNFIDITNDGVNELIFLHSSGAGFYNLAIYGYCTRNKEVVCYYDGRIFSHFSSDQWGEAFLLDNGNVLLITTDHSLGIVNETVTEIELCTDGNSYTIDMWNNKVYYNIARKTWTYRGPVQGVDAEESAKLNDESVEPSEYFAAYEDYKKHIVLPVMPIPDRFANDNYTFTEDLTLDRANSVITSNVFSKGDYYFYDEIVVLLGGAAPQKDTKHYSHVSSTYNDYFDGVVMTYTKTESDYDANNNLIKETIKPSDGMASVNEYEYDSSNRLTRKTSYYTDYPNDKMVTVYEYDNANNMIKETITNGDGSSGGWKAYEYDSSNNLIKMVYYMSNGTVLEAEGYEYDSSNRLIKKTEYANNNEVTGWTEYEYDSVNNVIKESYYSSQGSLDYWYEYEYDSSNRMIRIDDFYGSPNVGSTTLYEYDEYDNLIKQEHYQNDELLSDHTYVYTYD